MYLHAKEMHKKITHLLAKEIESEIKINRMFPSGHQFSGQHLGRRNFESQRLKMTIFMPWINNPRSEEDHIWIDEFCFRP